MYLLTQSWRDRHPSKLLRGRRARRFSTTHTCSTVKPGSPSFPGDQSTVPSSICFGTARIRTRWPPSPPWPRAGVIAHVGDYGAFSLISRQVIDAFLQVQDRDRHFLFILHWLGFRVSEIEYEHGARFAGESTYTFARLLSHAMDGVFFQTTRLLRLIVYLGFAISFAGLCLAVFFSYKRLTGTMLEGWTGLVVLTTVLGGMILTSTGIAALYIGKVFEQVKARPLYIVRRTARGGDTSPQPTPDASPP